MIKIIRWFGISSIIFMAAAGWGANLTPFGDFERGGCGDRPAEFWYRAGNEYLSAWPDWKLTEEQKVSGRYSVMTDTIREFIVCGETMPGWITGSVSLRADKPGTKIIIRMSWCGPNLNRIDKTETVDVGTAWEKHTIKVEAIKGQSVDLAVRAEKAGIRIWADDFIIDGNPVSDQFTNNVTVYDQCKTQTNAPTTGIPKPSYNKAQVKSTPMDVVRAKPVDIAKLQEYTGEGRDGQGRVGLTIDAPESAVEMPYVTGGVPFPRGKLFHRDRVRLVDEDGREVAAQFDILSRWPADGSIMALLVTTPLPVKGNRLFLEFGPAMRPAEITEQLDPKAGERLPILTPWVIGAEGEVYEPANRTTRAELAGPLRMIWTVEGRLKWPGGKSVGRYVTRATLWRGSKRYAVAHSWINDEKDTSIPIHGAGLKGFPLGSSKAPSLLTQVALNKVFFSSTATDVVLPVAPPASTNVINRENGLFGGALAVRDFWQNHPMAVESKADGQVVWLWPETVRGVFIPQGFARQWDFLVDPDGGLKRPYATVAMPILRPDPQWMCDSGVFEFIMPPDPERFPIFEERVNVMKVLGRFALSEKESRNLYGVFNYGDATGDGWSNLESMADHELFLHWMRGRDREHYDMARLAAEHYRDMDIHHGAGFAHYHCFNHVAAGENWSHAWIQGLRDLYFLQGDLGSLEVLAQMGERLVQKPAGFESGRDWTRALDNMVDIYSVTGDQRCLTALKEQFAELRRRQLPETAVTGAERFSWYEDLYWAGCAFTWYGCQAMAKLHLLTNDADILNTLRREMDLSIDVQTKSLQSRYILPGEKLTQDHQAMELGNFAFGRGSTLFPPLGYLSSTTGDRHYLDLGMKILAHYMLNLRSGSDNPATAYATIFLRYARDAGLGATDEAKAFRQARDFSYERWPKGVANGGFEENNFAYWRGEGAKKVPGLNYYYSDLLKVGSYLDENVKRSGRRSLRVHSDDRMRSMSVYGSFALEPERRYRASFWYRADETIQPSWGLALREYDTDNYSGVNLAPTGREDRGWKEVAGNFMTGARTVAEFSLGHRSGTGDAWFDDVAIEDKGKALVLLTANGLGRESDKKPPYPALTLDTGGSYVADKPMSETAAKEGEPILFTKGELTDGANGGYAFWLKQDSGSILFDLKKPFPVRQVRVNVMIDEGRKAHGVRRIELHLNDAAGKLLGAIEPAKNGWNEFDGLDVEAQKLAVVVTKLEGRTYLTLSEVEIWGEKPSSSSSKAADLQQIRKIK